MALTQGAIAGLHTVALEEESGGRQGRTRRYRFLLRQRCKRAVLHAGGWTAGR
jgi:hypothetical protein